MQISRIVTDRGMVEELAARAAERAELHWQSIQPAPAEGWASRAFSAALGGALPRADAALGRLLSVQALFEQAYAALPGTRAELQLNLDPLTAMRATPYLRPVSSTPPIPWPPEVLQREWLVASGDRWKVVALRAVREQTVANGFARRELGGAFVPVANTFEVAEFVDEITWRVTGPLRGTPGDLPFTLSTVEPRSTAQRFSVTWTGAQPELKLMETQAQSDGSLVVVWRTPPMGAQYDHFGPYPDVDDDTSLPPAGELEARLHVAHPRLDLECEPRLQRLPAAFVASAAAVFRMLLVLCLVIMGPATAAEPEKARGMVEQAVESYRQGLGLELRSGDEPAAPTPLATPADAAPRAARSIVDRAVDEYRSGLKIRLSEPLAEPTTPTTAVAKSAPPGLGGEIWMQLKHALRAAELRSGISESAATTRRSGR